MIITNRLQAVLPMLINDKQSAFVKGRHIADNILMMQELVREYYIDRGAQRCAFKVDIMKAYDIVSWEYLLMCLMWLKSQLK